MDMQRAFGIQRVQESADVEEDLLAHIEKQLGASDKETCAQIEKILIYPDGRVEIEIK